MERRSGKATRLTKGRYLLSTSCRRTSARGAGHRLFSAVARRLHEAGFDAFLLWVLKDNLPARRFYESLGGTYLTEKTITIGETDLSEVAYGWRDTADITGEA